MTGATIHPVRAHREAIGLSVVGLAFKAGVTPRTIERIENGEVTKPQPATLAVLARVLKVKPEDLNGGPDEAAA